jgi:hypothetical protein
MSIEYKDKATDIGSMQTEIAKMKAAAQSAHIPYQRSLQALQVE